MADCAYHYRWQPSEALRLCGSEMLWWHAQLRRNLLPKAPPPEEDGVTVVVEKGGARDGQDA